MKVAAPSIPDLTAIHSVCQWKRFYFERTSNFIPLTFNSAVFNNENSRNCWHNIPSFTQLAIFLFTVQTDIVSVTEALWKRFIASSSHKPWRISWYRLSPKKLNFHPIYLELTNSLYRVICLVCQDFILGKHYTSCSLSFKYNLFCWIWKVPE